MKRTLPALALLAMALGGCHRPSIVGTWNGSVTPFTLNITFNEDGTLTGNGQEQNLKIQGSFTGNYKLKDEELAITITSVQTNFPSIPNAIVQDKVQNALRLGKLKWIDGDHIELSKGEQKATLTRNK